jgi:flagellar motility protein MotE (MotC chaperone)
MKTGYDQFFQKAKEASNLKSQVDLKKLQSKKQQSISKTKKKSKFPIVQFFSFAMVALGALALFEHSEDIEKQLRRIDIGFSVASAEEKSHEPQKNEHADKKDEKPTEGKAEAKVEAKPDETDYLFKLSERKKQLDLREEELNRYAAEIAKQKEDIEAKLKKLEETRSKISTALEDKIKTDDAKVDTLVQMYSNMKAQQAAKVFETLDEDLVIEILSRMKKKNAADILNLVKPEKAQVLAERYAGYRVPASK